MVAPFGLPQPCSTDVPRRRALIISVQPLCVLPRLDWSRGEKRLESDWGQGMAQIPPLRRTRMDGRSGLKITTMLVLSGHFGLLET